ncbi:MAG: hypothetical protein NVSMB63_12700 [Sediminibacterium sp.]
MKGTILIILSFFTILKLGHSQAAIYGISCVTPGVEYEYRFNAGWDSTVSVQVCVTGGVISGNNSNCKTAGGLSLVKISWNENNGNGSIQVNYPGGHLAKNVNITPELKGGQIDNTKKTQLIAYKSLPADIECSECKGGGCNPSYSYQWQQSADILNWKDIPGAQNKYLKVSSPLIQSLYYRRKVKENNSGSIAYSNEAVVFVEPDKAGHN